MPSSTPHSLNTFTNGRCHTARGGRTGGGAGGGGPPSSQPPRPLPDPAPRARAPERTASLVKAWGASTPGAPWGREHRRRRCRGRGWRGWPGGPAARGAPPPGPGHPAGGGAEPSPPPPAPPPPGTIRGLGAGRGARRGRGRAGRARADPARHALLGWTTLFCSSAAIAGGAGGPAPSPAPLPRRGVRLLFFLSLSLTVTVCESLNEWPGGKQPARAARGHVIRQSGSSSSAPRAPSGTTHANIGSTRSARYSRRVNIGPTHAAHEYDLYIFMPYRSPGIHDP